MKNIRFTTQTLWILVSIAIFSVNSFSADSVSDEQNRTEKGVQKKGLINSLTFSFYDLVKDYKYESVTLPAPPNFREAHPQSEFFYNYKTRSSDETLAFIVPGFGGLNTTGVSLYLMQVLSRNSVSSVVIDSPASQRFIEKSSFFGFSGLPESDATDVETVCLQFKNWIESKRQKSFQRLVIIGTSLGGYNVTTLFLKKDRSQLKFDKYISISAPLSNLYGLDRINEMVSLYKKSNSQDSELPHFLKIIFRAIREINPLDYISESDLAKKIFEFTTNTVLSEQEAKVLIGRSFYQTLETAKKAFWTRYKNDPYLHMPKDIKKISSFNDYVGGVSLGCQIPDSDLMNGPLLAYRRDSIFYTDGSQTLQKSRILGGKSDLCSDRLGAQQELIESTSIIRNLDALNSDQFAMISWEDDFLISQSLIETTRSKNRNFHLLNEGGHLGGFYQQEFQDLLLSLLFGKDEGPL